jgi:hypothetical protein
MTPQVKQILKDMKSQEVPVVKDVKIQADALDARVEEEIKEVKEDPNTFHLSQGYPLKK